MQLPSSTPLFLNPKPTRPVKREPSKEELDEVRYAFDTLDADHVGSVSQKHLKVALRAMGFPVKKADVTELLRRHGDEDSERLDWPAFLRAVSDKLAQRSPQEDARRAFQLFDLHSTGKIDLPALRKVVKSLGLNIPDEELQEMIHEFDTDHDGMISEGEFLEVMRATED